MVMGNVYSIHFDEKEWDNPEAFLPERWIDQKTGEYIFQEHGFMAFSIGRHACIGESFAKLEIHMIITLVLQKYNLKPKPGFQVDLSPEISFDFQPRKQDIVLERW